MTYTYRFADLLSDTDLADLELSNVKFDRRIIVPGSFSADIDVTNEDTAIEVRKVVPGRAIVHVYRDTEIWGSYIIWQMKVRSSTAGTTTVSLSGASLESWLYRRIIDVELNYSATDQIDIMRDMVLNGQIGWWPYPNSANLLIDVMDGVSGVSRDRSYKLSDGASIGQRLEELANVDNGFEYMIKTYYDEENDCRKRELVWGYPIINQGLRPAEFYYPGNITSYELSYDSSDAATAFWTRGDSISEDGTENNEPQMISSPYLAGAYLSNGWPHLDKVIDYPSVIDLGTLEAYAKWWRDNHAGMVIIPQFDINYNDITTIFSPNEIGSKATFTITDSFFPLANDGTPTYSGEFRIVGLEVSPPQRGSAESVRMVIESEFDPTDIGGNQ